MASDLSPAKAPLSILVVDDSEIVREVVCDTLSAEGWLVTSVGSPFGFSNLVRTTQPHVVLMDIEMPGLRGTSLVSLARSNGRAGCKILLYSDRPERELAREVRECGADGFVSKSLIGPDLVSAIRQQLGGL